MKKIVFLTLAWLGAAALPLAAQTPGTLDTSFGNQGAITTTVSNEFASCAGIIAQPDRKIIVAGGAANSGQLSHGVMLRYLPDGQGLDPSFGDNGQVQSHLDTTISYGSGINYPILLANGNIVAGLGGNFATGRFLPDGRIDSSFNGTGVAYLSTLVTGAYGHQGGGMKIQPDGKIVHAGTAQCLNASFSRIIVVRFNADGSPDLGFGPSHQGFIMSDLAAWGLDYSNGHQVLVQADGKIIVVGEAAASIWRHTILVRYLADGSSVDSTFGNNGVATGFMSNDDMWGFAYLQSDEKVMVGIAPQNAQTGNYDFGLMRFLPNGSLDPSFGTSGKVRKQFSLSGSSLGSGLLQPDNKVVLAGAYTDDNLPQQQSHFVLIRYNEDGTLDASFQANDHDGGCAYGLTLDNEEKILACGAHSGTTFKICRFFSGIELAVKDKENNDLGLQLFPNPSQKSLTLRYVLTKKESITISLWNNQWEKFHTFSANVREDVGEHNHSFDLPKNLPNGVYFVQFETTKNTHYVKFIK